MPAKKPVRKIEPPPQGSPAKPGPRKHGQPALMETVLKIVDSSLEDLEEPGKKQNNQQ